MLSKCRPVGCRLGRLRLAETNLPISRAGLSAPRFLPASTSPFLPRLPGPLPPGTEVGDCSLALDLRDGQVQGMEEPGAGLRRWRPGHCSRTLGSFLQSSVRSFCYVPWC